MRVTRKTKAAVAVTTAVLALGGGGIALAQTASATTTGHGHRAHGSRLRHVEHGQFTTGKGKGTPVTHDVANGTVTAVSATALTVEAADGTSVSFTVSGATKVHVKGQAKGTSSGIATVKTGQDVMVVGTGGGSGPYAATFVFDRG